MKRSNLLFLVGLVAFSMSVPIQAGPIFDVSLDPALFGNLKQGDVDGCADDPKGTIACGPTAATNSFAYLQRISPSTYDTKLIPDINGNNMIDYAELQAVANKLALPAYMNCALCPPHQFGTFHDDFIFGKQKYLEEAMPERTRYAAQDPFAFDNPDRPKPEYVQPVNPDFFFMFNQLKSGEDVEILINGASNHYLTLTSLHWDDVNLNGTIELGEGMMDYIDPDTGLLGLSNIYTNVYTNGQFIGTDFNPNGNSNITVAVSESPIPEPATLLLLVAGLVAFGLHARNRRGKALGQ